MNIKIKSTCSIMALVSLSLVSCAQNNNPGKKIESQNNTTDAQKKIDKEIPAINYNDFEYKKKNEEIYYKPTLVVTDQNKKRQTPGELYELQAKKMLEQETFNTDNKVQFQRKLEVFENDPKNANLQVEEKTSKETNINKPPHANAATQTLNTGPVHREDIPIGFNEKHNIIQEETHDKPTLIVTDADSKNVTTKNIESIKPLAASVNELTVNTETVRRGDIPITEEYSGELQEPQDINIIKEVTHNNENTIDNELSNTGSIIDVKNSKETDINKIISANTYPQNVNTNNNHDGNFLNDQDDYEHVDIEYSENDPRPNPNKVQEDSLNEGTLLASLQMINTNPNLSEIKHTDFDSSNLEAEEKIADNAQESQKTDSAQKILSFKIEKENKRNIGYIVENDIIQSLKMVNKAKIKKKDDSLRILYSGIFSDGLDEFKIPVTVTMPEGMTFTDLRSNIKTNSPYEICKNFEFKLTNIENSFYISFDKVNNLSNIETAVPCEYELINQLDTETQSENKSDSKFVVLLNKTFEGWCKIDSQNVKNFLFYEQEKTNFNQALMSKNLCDATSILIKDKHLEKNIEHLNETLINKYKYVEIDSLKNNLADQNGDLIEITTHLPVYDLSALTGFVNLQTINLNGHKLNKIQEGFFADFIDLKEINIIGKTEEKCKKDEKIKNPLCIGTRIEMAVPRTEKNKKPTYSISEIREKLLNNSETIKVDGIKE